MEFKEVNHIEVNFTQEEISAISAVHDIFWDIRERMGSSSCATDENVYSLSYINSVVEFLFDVYETESATITGT